MASAIQTFAGNVGIGTDDPKAYALNVANGGTTRMTSLAATNITVNGVTNAFIPQGSIGLWPVNGSTPTGWVVCDGQNGTPDLRDRFIIGAGTSYAVNATGGAPYSRSYSNSNMPQHTHNGTTGTESANHVHYVSDPSHYHRQKATDDAYNYEQTSSQSTNYSAQTGFDTYGANANVYLGNETVSHSHSFSTSSYGGNSSVQTWPSWITMHFIMKT
jgi:microcystin-dependent protein